MTLRDYFAGIALGRLVDLRDCTRDSYDKKMAKSAYRIADAMLAERQTIEEA